jgi:hypothetical protein
VPGSSSGGTSSACVHACPAATTAPSAPENVPSAESETDPALLNRPAPAPLQSRHPTTIRDDPTNGNSRGLYFLVAALPTGRIVAPSSFLNDTPSAERARHLGGAVLGGGFAGELGAGAGEQLRSYRVPLPLGGPLTGRDRGGLDGPRGSPAGPVAG